MRHFIPLILLFLLATLNMSAQAIDCFGYEMYSNTQYYRGIGSAIASNSRVAEQKALLIARQRIITQIEVTVNSATELYLHNTRNDNQHQITLSNIIQTLSKQLLIGVNLICHETRQIKDGNYESIVAIELPTQNIIETINLQNDTSFAWKQISQIIESQIIEAQ